MTLIRTADDDFRVCRIDLDKLIDLQKSAERSGWSTRWSSVEALRSQVAEGAVLLQTYLRQRAADGRDSVRCFALFALVGGAAAGGVATLDVDPDELRLIPRIDTDPVVRSAMVDVFVLAAGNIEMMTKV